MKAVGYKRARPLDDPERLLDVDLPEPVPGPHYLLVDIKAVSVNPVDTKVRRSTNPPAGKLKCSAGMPRALYEVLVVR